jgi:hypothetical protein
MADWLNDIDVAYAQLRSLREAVADLHKSTDEAEELVASSRDAMRVASGRATPRPPRWMQARFAWLDVKLTPPTSVPESAASFPRPDVAPIP